MDIMYIPESCHPWAIHFDGQPVFTQPQGVLAPNFVPNNPFYNKRMANGPRKFQEYMCANYSDANSFETFSPWNISERTYSSGIKGLTEEINDFYVYIQPNSANKAQRDQVIERVKSAIHEKWPEAIVEIFGSYKTGLYLPTGDIDLVIQGRWEVIPPLFDLERQLIDKNVGEKSSFKVLDKASVPLIKFRDAETLIRVDLAFNQANCTEAASFVKECCQTFPPLPKLIYVLKQYLSTRNLNEVFHGGISSYSLTLMILSFLQLYPDQDMVRRESADTGRLLMDFLEFYTERFDYDKQGIRIRNGGALLDKATLREELIKAGGPPVTCSNMLCIEDPLTPGNDVARSSYAFNRVRDAFKSMFLILQKCVHPSLSQVLLCPRNLSNACMPLQLIFPTYMHMQFHDDLGNQMKNSNHHVRKSHNDYKHYNGKRQRHPPPLQFNNRWPNDFRQDRNYNSNENSPHQNRGKESTKDNS